MELSVEKPVVPDIPKKPRPFNLHSIYVKKPAGSDRKSWAQKELLGAREIAKALKRKRSSSYDNGGSVLEELRSKRSRKEVSLSSLGPAIKRHRHNLKTTRPKQDGSVFAVGTGEKASTISGVSRSLDIANGKARHVGNDLTLASSKKKNCRSLEVGNLEKSSGLADSVVVPKRPRGITRWKKSEDPVSLKGATSNFKCGKSSTEVWNNESSIIVVPQSQVSNGRQRRKLNEFKENGSSRNSSVPHIEGGSGSSIQVSSRKVQNRRKQQSTMVKETNLGNEEPLIDNDEPFSGDFQDDDEENLEQNAARMLSSRFDPRCTGFSRNRMVPTTELASRSSLAQSFHHNLKDPVIEASPMDAAGRVLRPRKHNGKSFVRKRRHFYEVCSRDMDPYCIVKQRIKVFWPLDKTWYFGLVKDYDPITKLHHVKYDDRDEEWINLQNERFKLLLFPSEVRRKFNSENSLEQKPKSRQLEKDAMDDSGIGSLMESEPIISWLARSNRLVKSTPSNIIKKQGRANLLNDFEPSMSLEMKKHMAVSSSDLRSNKLFSKSDMPKKSSDKDIAEALVLKGKTGFENRKLSYVYFRKRFHYRKDGLGNNKLEQDFACGSSTGSISILASVADRAIVKGLNVISTSVEVKQVTLKLRLPTHYIHELSFGAESFWLCRTHFLLQCGKLMLVWPMVHMELIFVDNAQGLRILLFEGCLKWAVSILCVIIRTFYQHTDQSNFIELEMPCTSIGFKISGLHDQGGELLIILYSFFKLNESKWKFLEDKLELHCMKVKELPVPEITYSSIKNLPRKSDQILWTSDFKDPASLEDCSEGYCSDLVQGLIPNKLFYLNTNPTVCYLDEKRPLQCTFFLPALPSFLLSIHVKFLIENNAASVCSQKPTTISSQEHPGNNDQLAAISCSFVEESSDQVSEVTHENLGTSLGQAAASSGRRETDSLSASCDGDWMKSSHDLITASSSEVKVIENSVGLGDAENSSHGDTVDVREMLRCQIDSWKGADKSSSSYPEDSFSPDKSEGGCNSCMNATNVQAQLLDQVVEGHSFVKRTQAAEPASDLVWEMNERALYSANPTAPRSIWHRNRHSSASYAFGHHEKLWPEDFVQNGFASGSKKPRTQVTYSSSSGGCELGLKPQSNHRKAHTYKKMKNNNVKRSSGCLGNPQSYWDSLTCDANVLVTLSDRGRRDCGAQVVLDSDDQQNWRICVKFSGVTKYFHKVHHFLQPGTTNRYTHAMMWKGGKDWTLEFTDRNQWSFFKLMHEECYNRNIRAASVKNIPIPGVRLVADGDDNIVDMPFVRNPSIYFRQDVTEIDMALDPAHVLYDMDSGDEEWISTARNSSDSNCGKMIEITEDLFERVMDMFEKFAYAQQCNEFTGDEIEEFMADVGPLDVVKDIYEHWHQKRQKKGLPLIRQFQPALWELYEQQLKERESALSKMHSSSDGFPYKACLFKKPPMFAFCLRPRGLEVPNKGSKQRSHKKLIFTGHHNAFAREQDAFHAYGRKLNGPLVGEERTLFAIPSCESSDSIHWQSPTSFSPRDSARTEPLLTNDGLERFPHPKLNKSNSKKMAMLPSPRDSQITPFSYNQKSKRNGLHRLGLDMHDWPNTRQSQGDGYQNHRADIDEFRLRDASGAAQHASNMAKLKREKAERLLHRADVALRRALAAVMTAEAIKASEKDLIGDW